MPQNEHSAFTSLSIGLPKAICRKGQLINPPAAGSNNLCFGDLPCLYFFMSSYEKRLKFSPFICVTRLKIGSRLGAYCSTAPGHGTLSAAFPVQTCIALTAKHVSLDRFRVPSHPHKNGHGACSYFIGLNQTAPRVYHEGLTCLDIVETLSQEWLCANPPQLHSVV